MFEDSTFESTGRIHTHSRGWMLGALCFNGTILLMMVLIPLIYPEALTRMGAINSICVPPPPPPAAKPQPLQAHPAQRTILVNTGEIFAPRTIPPIIQAVNDRDEAGVGNAIGVIGIPEGPGGANPFFIGNRGTPNVRPASNGPTRLPSTIVEGLIIRKTMPVYPPIARAAHVEGTVVLQASISAAGTIEKLRVASGPAMLRQAALDAVRDWRYRPYELNGEPVEVETTVNVIFALSR
jgi:protein TonB